MLKSQTKSLQLSFNDRPPEFLFALDEASKVGSESWSERHYPNLLKAFIGVRAVDHFAEVIRQLLNDSRWGSSRDEKTSPSEREQPRNCFRGNGNIRFSGHSFTRHDCKRPDV